MSDAWRIVVVESDEPLNQNVVSALRKDGYMVQGVVNGADAVRVLWSETCDVVICDMTTPDTDGFELLQWLRVYRPNVRPIMLGEANKQALRVQALESGAVSYLEKPLDLRQLREELRRLLQQSGFSASLDSFDLLDVIQIITMSRKSIALFINTGLEEHGTLRFKNGELVWADYGILRGEEAFFALAAHKNGTVTQQLWDEQGVVNVTQPLSRLIFQALQYRTKYANRKQYTGEQEAVNAPVSGATFEPLAMLDVDDRPFVFVPEVETEPTLLQEPEVAYEPLPIASLEPVMMNEMDQRDSKEWWERTGEITRIPAGQQDSLASTLAVDPQIMRQVLSREPVEPVAPTAARPPTDLPSWLTDQPTAASMAIPRQPAMQVPVTPIVPTPSGEWQIPASTMKTAEEMARKQATMPQQAQAREVAQVSAFPMEWSQSQPAFNPGMVGAANIDVVQRKAPLSTEESAPVNRGSQNLGGVSGPLQEPGPAVSSNTGTFTAQRAAARRNYTALVSALQTLGYSIAGFVAAAVVSIEGQPIAQVAIDDLDISKVCKPFSAIQRSVLLTAEQGNWGEYEETVITCRAQHILMRVVGVDKKAFLVLITGRETNPAESLEVMANVEGAISAALR